ncbi:MAG: hypothetical protein EBR23_12265 [Planctomycetia bacterium]|nr:hypothetical protein [Planctomycetia bacterium]
MPSKAQNTPTMTPLSTKKAPMSGSASNNEPTTATATHATPAGFATTVAKRSDQKAVAAQYLERGVDVVLGGGTQYFSDELVAAYRKAGYGVALNRGQLLADAGKAPLLGLFSKSHVPFEIDRLNSAELKASTPTLAEMTKVALQRLGSAPEGFFLMVEGGRIDHAARRAADRLVNRDQPREWETHTAPRSPRGRAPPGASARAAAADRPPPLPPGGRT